MGGGGSFVFLFKVIEAPLFHVACEPFHCCSVSNMQRTSGLK